MSRPASRTSSPTRSTPRSTSSASSSSSDSNSPTRPDQPCSTTTPNTSLTSSTQSPVPHSGYYYPSSDRTTTTTPTTTTSLSSTSILGVDPSYVNAPILSEYLEQNFVPSVVPLPEEYQAKEQARQYLEKLVQTISPGSKLLPFGSMANGFALKNSDMDLCCFLGKDAPVRQPSELVEQLGTLIERETNFYVKMLPRARIPIIKLNMPPTATIPEGMACDIGFENRLALENTRLLLTYAMVDPRLRTLVLFLKVWTKRRKINNPYRGTLSSYGYVLLVIHFCSHVIKPPIVPNLQRLPLPESTPLEDLTYQGHDISFFDDLDQLSTVFPGLHQNLESSGELLIDFFKYFANGFDYAKSVISIRSEKGTLGKEEKGWNSDIEFDPEMIVRDSHKLCIEDPFALDYNVARTVTKDGLYTIRGEFMRAVRILTTSLPRNTQSGDRITAIMNELCAEREDFLLMHPPPGDHHHHHLHNNHKSPLLQSSPSPFHPHPPPPSSLTTSSLPISKSPRRRSAPSPQLRPAPPPTTSHPHHLAAPPPSNQQQFNPPSLTSTTSRSSQSDGNGNGVKVSPDEGTTMTMNGYDQSSTTATTGQQQHLQPPSYPVSRVSPVPSPSTSQYHSPTPSSVSSSVAGDATLDRRSSFESTQTGSTTTTTTNQYDLHRFFQNPPTSTTSSSSMSDAGTNNSHHHHQGGYYHHHPRTTVSLTAPSSPDLTPIAYYNHHNTGGYQQGGNIYSSRSPYRYPSSGYTSGGGGGSSSSSSSSRHASVPRNPHHHHHQPLHHQPHHYAASLNPYANPPAPSYPLASTSNGTSSSSPYPPYPLSSSSTNSTITPSSSSSTSSTVPLSHLQQQQTTTTTTTTHQTTSTSTSTSTSPLLLPPRPIFPLEDRETIARASSITFGNFPTTTTTRPGEEVLPPLPRDFAHYHALGGSNAYLSGNGGWGVQPYGMGSGLGSIATVSSSNNHNTTGSLSSSSHFVLQQQQQREQEQQRRVGGGGTGVEDSEVDQQEEEEGEDEDSTSQFELDSTTVTVSTTGTTGGTGTMNHNHDGFVDSTTTTRGRSINGGSSNFPTPLQHLSHVVSTTATAHQPSNSNSRQRGRSVPQTRMGPDGREYVLFGAIQVTLPKPEDVQAAESELEFEEEERQQQQRQREEGEEVVVAEGLSEQHDEVVDKQADDQEKEEEEKEEGKVEEIFGTESILEKSRPSSPPPTLTTSPPTPAKPIYASCRPLSPLFNATSNNDRSDDVEEETDLDKTPRPASPRPLPDVNGGGGGIDLDGSEVAPPPTPPPATRSKHAAKRARQNERKKIAQNNPSSSSSSSSPSTPSTPLSPRPLALTSNSLV